MNAGGVPLSVGAFSPRPKESRKEESPTNEPSMFIFHPCLTLLERDKDAQNVRHWKREEWKRVKGNPNMEFSGYTGQRGKQQGDVRHHLCRHCINTTETAGKINGGWQLKVCKLRTVIFRSKQPAVGNPPSVLFTLHRKSVDVTVVYFHSEEIIQVISLLSFFFFCSCISFKCHVCFNFSFISRFFFFYF